MNGITVVNNTYDAYGRKTQSVEANAGTMAYEYDESDNITKVTDANNKVTTMTYDGLNRLINRNNRKAILFLNITIRPTTSR